MLELFQIHHQNLNQGTSCFDILKKGHELIT
jgi:hypothetical protein